MPAGYIFISFLRITLEAEMYCFGHGVLALEKEWKQRGAFFLKYLSSHSALTSLHHRATFESFDCENPRNDLAVWLSEAQRLSHPWPDPLTFASDRKWLVTWTTALEGGGGPYPVVFCSSILPLCLICHTDCGHSEVTSYSWAYMQLLLQINLG